MTTSGLPSPSHLLELGRLALDERRFDDAERVFRRILKNSPHHREAQQGLDTIEFQRIADAEQDRSVDWQAQYAAGPDESIDQPPPLASDLFATHPSHSGLDGSESGLSHSGYDAPSESVRADGNPSLDPMKWSTARISGGHESSAQTETVTSKDGSNSKVQTGPLIAPPTPSPSTQRLNNSQPPPQYSFDAVQKTPRSVDTLDDEVDEGNESTMSMLQMADRRHHAGDFNGSMELVDRILEEEPEHPIAGALADLNRRELLHVHRARIGDLADVPRIQLRQSEFIWQKLSHTEGFVLSQIDGETCYSDIVEIAGMGEYDCMEILARLLELGIIG